MVLLGGFFAGSGGCYARLLGIEDLAYDDIMVLWYVNIVVEGNGK